MHSHVLRWVSNLLDVSLPISSHVYRKRRRRSAEGDRKALCSRPQARNPMLQKQPKKKTATKSDGDSKPPQTFGHAARLLRAAPPKYAPPEREVQRGRRPLWQRRPEEAEPPLVALADAKSLQIVLSYNRSVTPDIEKQRMKKYADNVIVLVYNGLAWHKSKVLGAPDNIVLSGISPCTQEMNPIEQIWRELRTRGFVMSPFLG